MLNLKKINDTRTRHYYIHIKHNNTIRYRTIDESTSLRSFNDAYSFMTYSYLKQELALIAIMNYINKNNLQDVKFEKNQ